MDENTCSQVVGSNNRMKGVRRLEKKDWLHANPKFSHSQSRKCPALALAFTKLRRNGRIGCKNNGNSINRPLRT